MATGRRPPPSSRRAAPRRRPPPQGRARRGSELRGRVLVAIPAIAGAIFIVVQGGLVFALAAAALGLICVHELFAMFRRMRPIVLAGFLGVIALALAALYGDQFQVVLVLMLTIPLTFVLALLRPQRDHVTLGIALTMLALTWIGLAIAHAVLLRELPHGDGIIVDVLVGTFIGDTAAYFGGRAFGRRPLAPRISPNKTVEGLVFGIVGAVAATWFAGLYQDWLSGTDALLIGLAVGITAPLGDLFESLLKRDAETKDTGRVFGAHGGALDRLDAVLFTVVAGYYVWSALL